MEMVPDIVVVNAKRTLGLGGDVECDVKGKTK
jgi:hypothetical protein